jgi:starvation-inducible outer membrane lipoprotein
MKSLVLCVSTLLLLTACATAPKPVPLTVECPKVPLLELAVQAQDYQNLMQSFLAGTVPPLLGLKPPSTHVFTPTSKSDAK